MLRTLRATCECKVCSYNGVEVLDMLESMNKWNRYIYVGRHWDRVS